MMNTTPWLSWGGMWLYVAVLIAYRNSVSPFDLNEADDALHLVVVIVRVFVFLSAV